MAQTQPTKDRTWQIDGDPFDVEDLDSLHAAIQEAAQILGRIGGAVIIVADREEIAPDMWATTRYLFRWSSYAPGKRKVDEQRPVEVVPEPDAAVA